MLVTEQSKINEFDELTKENEEDNEEDVLEANAIPLESSFLFLGAIGVITGLGYWPGIILLNYIGFEVFEWPTWEIFELLMLNITLDCINSMAVLLGISWTTPLVVAVGSLLNIPVSIVLDMIIHDYLLPWGGFLGIACIIAGFILLILADQMIEKSKKLASSNIFKKILFWSWHW